jgi:HAE1 family hydrophobic/amphiphilic exporter-1
VWYLTKLAMKQRAITILIALAITGATIWGTFQLKLEMIPDIELPFVVAITVYPDATSEEVAVDVTAPIENAIRDRWDGAGLEQVYSVSADTISVVYAEFEFGTNMQRVQETVQRDTSAGELELPPLVHALPGLNPDIQENPWIVRFDPSQFPVVIFSLTGSGLTSEQLGAIARTQVVPELENLDGVADVQIEGGEGEQVLIDLDPEKMNENGISMSTVLAVLSLQSAYTSLDEVRNVALGNGDVVLGDVAVAADFPVAPAPRTRITRTDGETSVGIAVVKAKDANTVDTANAAVARAEELAAELGNGLKLAPVFSQAEFIEESISELTNMALVGAALAIVIVFVFLAAFRASLVTAASIPLSILIGFLAMYASNITVNMLTLSAMAIAVGRLIDNSIVVAEVVYRRMKQGEGFLEASIGGSKEVAGPITSSTIATVAIFIPLMFVGGIVGELFIPFALTMTYALVASLLVALMVVPAFARWFGRAGTELKAAAVREAWYVRLYMPALRWALGHRALTLLVALVLFLGSMGLVPVIGTSFLPDMPMGMLLVKVELPSGAEISTTSAVAAKVEALLSGNDRIESYHTSVGVSGTSMHSIESVVMGGGDHTAEIMILLDSDADLDKEKKALETAVAGLRQGDLMLGDYVTVQSGEEAQGQGMGLSEGLEVNVKGDSAADVEQAAEMLYERLGDLDGITSLETDLSRVVLLLDIQLDYAEIAARGLVPEELHNEVQLLQMGGSVSGASVEVDGRSHGMYIKGVTGQLGYREDPDRALAVARLLRVGGSESVALGDVAAVDVSLRPTHVYRIDGKLSASITGDITASDVGAVNRLVEKEIDAVEEEIAALGIDGVEIDTGGVFEVMTESFQKMGIAIIIAIIIAYVILVLTMRSILNPLIIMVSLPLASIGALIGLLAGGYTLGMSGMMGMLMLVGIVLTNAIVLIAVVEQLKKEGTATNDALIEGGRIRLRPILMTALTTMFAMLPLAFGLGAGTLLAAELAVVVIGGLFSSTLLTLLVIPVIYSLVDGVRQRRAEGR